MADIEMTESAEKVTGTAKRKPELTIRAEPYWLIEIETRQARILLKLNKGKIDKLEQTEIIKM